MARPKKQEHEKRSASLPPVRVTEAELSIIEQKARDAGRSVTDYLRSCALDAKVIAPRSSKLEASFLLELNRIGVNLNQIALAFNTGRSDVAMLDDTIRELMTLMDKVGAVCDS